jgi:hypothetical protein
VAGKTEPQPRRPNRILVNPLYIAILVVGAAAGILAGLSASPVVSILLSTMLGLAGAGVSVLGGLPHNTDPSGETNEPTSTGLMPQAFVQPRVAFLALCVLSIGLVGGGCLGIWMRTNDVLAANPVRISSKWSDSTGLSKREIARRVFDEIHPPAGGESLRDAEGPQKPREQNETVAPSPATGLLFASPSLSSDCRLLKDLEAMPRRQRLASLSDDRLKRLQRYVQDDRLLGRLVRDVVCADQ